MEVSGQFHVPAALPSEEVEGGKNNWQMKFWENTDNWQ
jgi:hypothetical protein